MAVGGEGEDCAMTNYPEAASTWHQDLDTRRNPFTALRVLSAEEVREADDRQKRVVTVQVTLRKTRKFAPLIYNDEGLKKVQEQARIWIDEAFSACLSGSLGNHTYGFLDDPTLVANTRPTSGVSDTVSTQEFLSPSPNPKFQVGDRVIVKTGQQSNHGNHAVEPGNLGVVIRLHTNDDLSKLFAVQFQNDVCMWIDAEKIALERDSVAVSDACAHGPTNMHQPEISLRTASGTELHYWGIIYGLNRRPSEPDAQYRERIMAHVEALNPQPSIKTP